MAEVKAASLSIASPVAIPKFTVEGVSVRLVFSKESNQAAPALIRELLRNSYLKRMALESRRET